MINKVITGCVVVFWAVMMTALVRVEFFPRESHLMSVTPEHVLAKIFQNEESDRLNVIYNDQQIGSFQLNISPVAAINTGELSQAVRQLDHYHLDATLYLNLVVFGVPSRFSTSARAEFNRQYELQSYKVDTKLGASRVNFDGDNQLKKLTVNFDNGTGPQQRQVDYNNLGQGGAELLDALGLTGPQGFPGLGNLGFLTGLGGGGSTGKKPAIHMRTRAYHDTLTIGGLEQRVYLVESRVDEGLGVWTKIWVDEQGHILRADTSVGLKLISASLEGADAQKIVDRTFEPIPHRP